MGLIARRVSFIDYSHLSCIRRDQSARSHGHGETTPPSKARRAAKCFDVSPLPLDLHSIRFSRACVLGCVASGLQSSSAQARDGEQGEGCGWEGDQAGPQGRCRDCEVVVGEGG